MNTNLLLILFGLFVFNVFGVGGNEVKKSKFSTIILKSINNGVSNGSVPDGPFCESITAYYVGTLENKKSKQSFDVEFQLRLWVDKTTKKIHVKVDDWNEEYSKSEDFELDFYYEGNRVWCDIDDEECVSPLAKKETSFKLDLNTASGNYFHLLNFNYFNNSFGLVQPKDKCTKHQLDGINDDWTPSGLLDKLGFCVCCGEYKPNKLLFCPNDEWSPRKTTQKPLPPTKSTPQKPRDITCKEVIGYYNGIFHTNEQPKIYAGVEFQTRLVANDVSRRVSFTIDRWNEQKAISNDYTIYVLNGEPNPPSTTCHPINGTTCSINYVNKTTSGFLFDIDQVSKGTWENRYWFSYFPSFNNSFTLTNAVGRCTKNQAQSLANAPNTTLYEYCVCCGSEYKPDPQLGCPKNPWA